MLQNLSFRNIIFLFSNKKRKRSTYVNNYNLNIINIIQYIFNFNFDILQNTKKLVWSLGRVEHFFLNSTHSFGPRRIGSRLRRELDLKVEIRQINAKNLS